MPSTVPSRSMPRRRDAARTRAAILQAAREVFIRGDYHQASLSDIAARAGVTQSLIHHHFGSKKGLYVAAMHAFLSDLDEDLQGIVRPALSATDGDAPDDCAAFIAEAVRGYFRFLAGNEQCVRLYRILDLSLHSDPELLAGLGELGDDGREMSSLHLIRVALDRLKRMKELGRLRPGVEPVALLAAILCVVEHWFTSSRRLNHRLSQALGVSGPEDCVSGEAFLHTVIDVVVHGALARAACPEPDAAAAGKKERS